MRGNGTTQIGYMRISKGEQTTALQEDALAKAAVERTYRDVMSGVRDDRPQCASDARLCASWRYYCGLAARSPGSFAQTPHRNGHGLAGPRDQLSESDRASGYINTGREVYLR